MGYLLSISSENPQSSQVHVSRFLPWSPQTRSRSDFVKRIAGSPQALHGRPGAFFGDISRAANRFSSSSTRPGASVIRFQSGHLSSRARISERTANAVS